MSNLQAFTLKLSVDEAAIFNRHTDAHGGRKAAFMAGLAALDRQDEIAQPGAVDVPAILETAARELRQLRRLTRFASKKAQQ